MYYYIVSHVGDIISEISPKIYNRDTKFAEISDLAINQFAIGRDKNMLL